MSEEPENPEAPKPEELESLFGGLDLTPDWAKGSPGVSQSQPESRLRGGQGRGRGGGQSRDGGGRPRAPKSSRPNMQGVRVKPRRNSDAGNNDRGYDSGNRGGHQSRPRHQERAPRVPVHVDFIPEKKRLSKVVKVIRQSHRAYPLKVVAGKFMENASFISMKYTVKDTPEGQDDFYLFVCTANGMVFSDAQACEQYILDHGIEATYEFEEKEVEAPAGNFVCVGRHSRSGRLIGPPNWHGYQGRLENLRSEIAERVPMDAFMRGVEMVHDAELIEAWKKEVSTQRFYRKKLEKPTRGPEGEAKPESKSENESQESSAEPNESAEATVETANVETAAGETSTVEPPPAAEEAPGPEAATAVEEEQVDERPYEWSREQAEADFREHHLPKLIKKTKRAIMPGYLFDKMTDPSLLSLTRFHLNREHDRPNSIIFALRPAFKHMRLHVFRLHGQMFVSGIPPHPFPKDMKVVPEIQSILDYVAAHPGCNTQEALKSVSNQNDEIPAEIVSHFRWLIEKGHLLELQDDTLQLPITNRK